MNGYTVEKFELDIINVLLDLEHKNVVDYTDEAVDLIMMTTLHESGGLRYNRQVGGGPARGYIQMEGPTHDDIYLNYLRYKPDFYKVIVEDVPQGVMVEKDGMMIPDSEYLCVDEKYAIKMARMHYYRVPEALPKNTSKNYLTELSKYCKIHYNGPGKATQEKYLEDYLRYCPEYMR